VVSFFIGVDMQVKELIEKLSMLNPELEVYCCTDEDEIAFSKSKNIRAMPVQDPYELNATLFRDPTGELVVQPEDAASSRKIAVIDFGIDQR
jgi:hypothetical protein